MASNNDNSKKSKYALDRGYPGAFEGETVNRRMFMTGMAGGLGNVAVAAIGLPALGFALGPVFEKTETVGFQDISPESDFTDDSYVPKILTVIAGVGQVGKTTIYVRKNPAFGENGKSVKGKFPYIAISTRCAHLGCPVRFVSAAKQFICPCHGGTYGFEGEVNGGPPVRPLDRFETKVENGRVLVGDRFSVDSDLNQHEPRDPGEALDGIWKYLYPPRPTT